jgi:hypothetical protein
MYRHFINWDRILYLYIFVIFTITIGTVPMAYEGMEGRKNKMKNRNI